MNAANVDLENLMFRLNAQAMEIVSLRQLLESSVVRDPWLIAVINLVHEHHALGYDGTAVTTAHFNLCQDEDCGRFLVHDHGWIFGETGMFTLEHMMASIPKLCAMGLHILVLEPGRLDCPFTIRWETPSSCSPSSDDLDKTRLRWADMVYHPPTGPCTMFNTASSDDSD